MEHHPADALGFERIVFFSDAVFAIAITLLVLEIHVPHLEGAGGARALLEALLHLFPKLVGFVVSFAVIGKMWAEHHRVFRHLDGYDDGLVSRNLALLFFVAAMPFSTALSSENPQSGAALAFYAATLGLVGLAKVWLWRYASRRFLAAGVADATVRSIDRRSLAVPVSCAATAVAALAVGPPAWAGLALIPVVARVLDRPKPANG